MTKSTTPVLIVGGGPVGLSTALFLGRHGVRTMLLEKRDGTSMLPRAPGLQARTMELFRAAGFHQTVRALEMGDSHAYFEGGIIQTTTFAEIDDAVTLESPSLDGPRVSPERVMGGGQDRYEQVLVAKAREFGCDVRFATKLTSIEQDEDGVTAQAIDADGNPLTIRARYLVGADGGNSFTRRKLGVRRYGRGTVFDALSIYFRAPQLQAVLKDRKFILCYATKARGTLMSLSRLHGCDPWLATPLYYPDRGETPEDFPDERCVDIIRTAAGVDDLDVEIVWKVPWQGAQLVAETFRVGRVFLAGDAAHLHPPAGGFGANTGIHDAHNLAWKLAAVLAGTSTPRLLDTYDAERRPVAWTRHQQIFVRPDYRAEGDGIAAGEPVYDDAAMELGQLYRSAGILGAGDDLPVAARPEAWAGQPGTRAPHIWVDLHGKRMSTLDMFKRHWVLLADDDRWAAAASKASAALGIDVESMVLGTDVQPADALRKAFGWGHHGASLVRPDGYVAWRGDLSSDPVALVVNALSKAAFHSKY